MGKQIIEVLKQGKETKGTVVYEGELIPTIYIPKPTLAGSFGSGSRPKQLRVTIEEVE